jgi:hypothetical protein
MISSLTSTYISVGRSGFVADQELMVNGYGVSISSITVADLNGDGLLEIAVGMLGGDDVVLFTNDGTGKYQVTSYAIGVIRSSRLQPILTVMANPTWRF